MKAYKLIIVSILLVGSSLFGMQPAGLTPAEQFCAIASKEKSNTEGLNNWLKKLPIDVQCPKFKERTPLISAARAGRVWAVQFLLSRGANTEIRDKDGLTALAWAVIQLDKKLPIQYYVETVNELLKHGANVRSRDNNALTILHHAAASGPEMLMLLLATKAREDINDIGDAKKRRTPLGEAVRASRDAIIHVKDFEDAQFKNPQELDEALNKAIKELNDKAANKLSTEEVVKSIKALIRAGANPTIRDAFDNTLDYYINNVQLITEDEREALLNALGLPKGHRTIRYTERDLPEAIKLLHSLDDLLQQFGIGQKVKMTIWTVQAAQREHDEVRKYDILRLAMALISKIKEDMKETVKDQALYRDIEASINNIRIILRDAALIVIGKASAQAGPAQAAPAVERPYQAPAEQAYQPAAAPSPARPPAAAPPPAQVVREWAHAGPTPVPSHVLPPPVVYPARPVIGFTVTALENQSDRPVVVVMSAGPTKERLELSKYEEIPSNPGRPRQLNWHMDSSRGMANLSIESKLGEISIEVTSAGLTKVSKRSGREFLGDLSQIAKIIVRPNGFIEIVPAR